MTSASSDLPRFGLGAIDQISFAVKNVDEALPRYTAMFGGAFDVVDVIGLDVVVGGEFARVDLRLGFGRTGDIEVELVEVLDGPWPTLGWLSMNGEGLHHLRYPVADVGATRRAMVDEGFEVSMESADYNAFVYLTAPLLAGMTVELISRELTG